MNFGMLLKKNTKINTMKPLIISLLRFLIYLVLMFLCTIPIEADFKIGQANETNAIEFAQQSILLIAIFIAFMSLVYSRRHRTFMLILSLFLSMHLIRELDAWFDSHIFNLGWFPYVLVIAIVLIGVLIKNFKSFLKQIKSLSNTLGFGILLISFANLHVFTRLYGKPSNWHNIMGDKYLYSVERASEESVEIVAYMMILIAVVELFIFVKKDK